MPDTPDELVYLALGGAGEIGMNCYLYGYGAGRARRWIMVDLGLGFGDMETAPGVEVIVPDIGHIIAERDRLEAICLTHAHEDHIGAIQYLWDRLQVPIYARPFTAEVVRRSMAEAGLDIGAVRQVGQGERVRAGPFEVEWFPVTHSIPEASCLAIRTASGLVVHSGDFKLDPEPLLGQPIDMGVFDRLGAEGVLALACDSTNVFLEGAAGSEAEIVDNLERIIAEAPRAVAATTFASNVARLRTLANAARAAGRSIVVAGRAMRRMIEIAVQTGQLTDFPSTVPEDRAKDIPAENLFYLVTGSQGEGRAALARIAAGTHPTVTLAEGDTVHFLVQEHPRQRGGHLPAAQPTERARRAHRRQRHGAHPCLGPCPPGRSRADLPRAKAAHLAAHPWRAPPPGRARAPGLGAGAWPRRSSRRTAPWCASTAMRPGRSSMSRRAASISTARPRSARSTASSASG